MARGLYSLDGGVWNGVVVVVVAPSRAVMGTGPGAPRTTNRRCSHCHTRRWLAPRVRSHAVLGCVFFLYSAGEDGQDLAAWRWAGQVHVNLVVGELGESGWIMHGHESQPVGCVRCEGEGTGECGWIVEVEWLMTG